MLSYKSLKDHVYEYISNQIRDEALKPGEKINENVICEALKISRTPVREALIQLTNEGYIEQIPRRGFVVKTVSLNKVHNIYEIIGALEALAATACLNHPERINIKALKQYADDMAERINTMDYSGYYQLQNEFHKMMNEASGNDELSHLIEHLKKSFIRQSYTGSDPIEYQMALKKTNEEHYMIISLFEKGDAEALRHYIQDVHWNAKYASMEILT